MIEYYIEEKQSHMGQLSNENKSGTDWLSNPKKLSYEHKVTKTKSQTN